MRYVVTADQMRALDRATIDEIGLPGVVLMENAGRAVADAVCDSLAAARPSALVEGVGADSSVAVVCGAGNNGGDGYVVARILRERGVHATAFLVADPEQVAGDAAIHLGVFEQIGGVAVSIAAPSALAEHRDAIESATVVVDAVFGTGLAREVEGHARAVIETINRSRGAVVAVDIPSGLCADTGRELGLAVRADLTVTIALHKIATASEPGFARCGDIEVAPIGIPVELAAAEGIVVGLVERSDLAPIPHPGLLDHKANRGHLLLVAGSPGKRGAARLAAMAALRSGAGLVTVAAPGIDSDVMPDPVMTAELDSAANGRLVALRSLAKGKRAIAIGPGMPTDDGARSTVLGALAELEVPLIIDADGLNHIGTDLEKVADSTAPVILTPHPGEAARLLGSTTADVQRDRIAGARELARRTRAVVVLKGARTLVCDGIAGDEFVTINPTGNPGLATAGSGDVLTGIIAALVGQGINLGEAARLGVYLHGVAGDVAARDLGALSVCASDLIAALPEALSF
jgi:NAD(P)H-hydrate epimerase